MEIRKVPKRNDDPERRGDLNASIEAFRDQVKATIRDHGWALQVVPVGANYRVPFVYTVGLVQRGCTTELMVAGMPQAISVEILNQIAANMLNSGQTIPPTTWPLADDYVLQARPFVPAVAGRLHVGVARFYYGQEVVVTQYVWPDQGRRYPWDEGWDTGLMQPVGNTDDFLR